MDTLTKVLLTLALSLTFFGLVLMSSRSSERNLGSVGDSSMAYVSTTTRSVSGVALTSPSLICGGYGTFGSVVITGAGSGVMNFYDGTSTVQHSDYATNTLATFPASTAAGTYTFDAAYTRGLLFEVVGSVGTSTITCKK